MLTPTPVHNLSSHLHFWESEKKGISSIFTQSLFKIREGKKIKIKQNKNMRSAPFLTTRSQHGANYHVICPGFLQVFGDICVSKQC